MTTMIVMTVISVAAVAFLIGVFVALCKDGPKEKCHVVHILRYPLEVRGDQESMSAASIHVGSHRPGTQRSRESYFATTGQAEWGC